MLFVENSLKSLGNVLFSGFDHDLSEFHERERIEIKPAHFNPFSGWKADDHKVVDLTTGDEYINDSQNVIRLKCAALFAATWIVHPIALLLNLINKICKIVSFAHLWKPANREYSFTARLGNLGKDLLLVAMTPLLFVGFVFSSLYGATLSPYNGRKVYATFERLAYSGGYQAFPIGTSLFSSLFGIGEPQNYLIAPCFQPYATAHLGGGQIDEKDAW